MRFILHDSALNSGSEVLDSIDRLIDRVADKVHRVEVPDADLLHASAWYMSARQTRRNILTSAVAVPPKKSVDPHNPKTKNIKVSNESEARVAVKLAYTPLTILVEDREADGVFLEILVEELGSTELRTIWTIGQNVTPRAIEIETAGGIGSMPARIHRKIFDAEAESRPVRLFVFCDSDKRWPGDKAPLTHELPVRQICTRQSIPLHVLQKRNAENYIPDAVIEAVRDDPRNTGNAHRFDALLRRNSVQRDHFPVKDGLTNIEQANAIAAGLYDPSEADDLNLLEVRLFPKRPRPFQLLKEERRPFFTGPGLLARDGNNEINTLLTAIALEL